MPKKKKTRKQKVLADVRQQSEPRITHTAIKKELPEAREEQLPAPAPKSPRLEKPARPRDIMTSDYPYLAGDLRKTLILTFAIIGLELFLAYGTGI